MTDQSPPNIRTDIPHSARIWNYWMGGKDNYKIDRTVGDMSLRIDPGIATMATESRRFLMRTVSYVTSTGRMRQFLDIGTGLPTMQNTHEVAQKRAPESKVVYVDNDPAVLAHARALLTSTSDEGVTDYIDRDFHDPDQIIAEARNILNFKKPIAVMFMGVLGHAESVKEQQRIVSTVMDAVPSGSYLIYWDGTTDSDAYVKLCEEYAKTGGAPYIPRSRDEIRAVFDGLEMVDPGFVSITEWHTNEADIEDSEPISAYGGVARKP
ncbi:SAM-dependent methyltransferase [Stackebrandtia nassauensis]|uniref:S-adenosyl methyltransferase n=1 Tax=Stackebrandtia nassauensis (strain DSM 44728 / CIP 108903 / NRRL B-16338 / NBRC 102104 / LLR-40K-21) TaxID=446470 RepID=D3PUM0_STANL|nr:SAM-dependent methyltransferase [Stackebrandtia nassauensis]ADD43033.1 protein of unknown function DUF574 [Stackebrandtia nassauensis DSM 44728]